MAGKKDTGIINIHGKDYQTVALRVKQFREKYRPEDGWFITTDIVEADQQVVRMAAWIGLNVDGSVEMYATGHAEEFRGSSGINKTSALENAETSAIGRALACFGLGGTEFASADEIARAVNGAVAEVSEADVDEMIEGMNECETMDALKVAFANAFNRVKDVNQRKLLTKAKDMVKAKLEAK